MTQNETTHPEVLDMDARDDGYDPLALARARLEVAIKANPALRPLIAAYTEALQRDDMNDVGTRRNLVDAAIKSIKKGGTDPETKNNPLYGYVERIEMLRAVQVDALAERQNGISNTLVKQVAERHQGR